LAKHARPRPKYPRAVAFLISALLLSGGFVSISHASVPPSITSISPTSGTAAGGTTVTVSGSNFDPTGTATTVRIDGVPVTPSSVTTTSLTFVTPVRNLMDRTVGAKEVVVQTGSGSSTETIYFTYRPEIDVTTKRERLVVLNALSSRSNAGPITRSGAAPWTVTGTDSLTNETYTYTYGKSSPSEYTSGGAYLSESYETFKAGVNVTGGSWTVAAGTKNLRSSINLTSSNNCTGSFSNNYRSRATYCSVFGPEVYSEPFYARAGQALSFNWIAEGGSDHYEVYAFLVAVDDAGLSSTPADNKHTLIAHGMGSVEPDWKTSSGNIPADGLYRFRFVNGSYDYSGGKALGARMFVDQTITVGDANAITFPVVGDQIGASGTFTHQLTSTSGQAVSISTSTAGVCSVSTNHSGSTTTATITKITAGTCILIASQGASGMYAPAAQVTRAFEVRATATVPTAPAITSIVGENGQLRVNFNIPDRDGGATITNYRYRIGTGSWVVMNPATISSPIVIPGLTNGTAYSITLSAINSVGDGTASTGVSGTPQASAPGAPTISAITAGDQSLSVAFTPPGNNGGSSITNYEYSINGSTWVTPSPAVTTSPIVISGLTNGTTYPVRVRAVNSSGSGAASNTVSATPTDSLGAPTILSVTPDDQSLIVSFNAPGSNGGSPITNYEYSIDGSTWITPSPAATTSPLVIPGLTNGTAYPVRIRAVNSAGPGAASNSITETPAGVAGSPSSGSVSTPGPALPTPTPTPSPSVSPRPAPQPTPSRQPTAVVPSLPLPVATPRPSVTAAPTPLPTPIVTPVAIPELRPSPGVVFNRTNPISQALVDILSSPLAYTRDGSSLSLPTMTPNQSMAIENGAPVSAPRAPTVNQNGYLIQGSNWQVSLEARSTSGEPLELDESGNLVLNSDRLVQFQGTGFAPGSTIKVWLFSDPASIAKVTADQNGSFSGSAKLSADIPEGEHTVQLNGLSTNGQIRSVALGVVVQPDVVATPIATPVDFTQLWNLVLVTAGVVMMFFLVLLARKRWFLIAAKRRKRKDEEQRKAFAMGVSEASPKQQFPNDSRRRIGAGSPPNRKRSSFKPKSA
jgi:hypothetical protein